MYKIATMYTLNILQFYLIKMKKYQCCQNAFETSGVAEIQRAKLSFSKFDRESVAKEAESFFWQEVGIHFKNLLNP